MTEHMPQLTSEEIRAISGGLARVLEATKKIYGDSISSHKIAPDVVSLRTTTEANRHEREDHTDQARKHLEIAKMTSYFIERIWTRLHQWNETHQNDFPIVDPRSGQMRIATETELKKMFGAVPYVDAYHAHATVVEHITRRYLRRLEGMLEATQGPPQGEVRIYMRYRDLVQESRFHRSHYRGDPARQISAGFMTGTLFSWALIGQIDALYSRHTGQKQITEHTRHLLEQAAMDFILLISRTWLDAFNVINDTVLERDSQAPDGKIVYLPILKHVVLSGDETRGFLFDIDRAGLMHIMHELKRKKNDGDLLHTHATHTMCPALIAAPEEMSGTKRKSAIIQLFEWSAEQARKHHKIM